MSKPTAFPLDESKLPFEIPKDAVLREKIVKLGQMITDRIPAKNRPLTAEDPEYWGLASIVTDEMADVALKMKVRKPMTLPEIVKATGKTAEELEPLLYKMSCVGLLEYNWENPRREKQYVLPMFVPGSAEFFNMNKQQIAEHPEVTAFFERMTFCRWSISPPWCRRAVQASACTLSPWKKPSRPRTNRWTLSISPTG